MLNLICCLDFCCRAQALGHLGFSSYGSRLWSTSLVVWYTSLDASQHVGSSWIRDQTHVSCTGKWVLYHWATKKALYPFIEYYSVYGLLIPHWNVFIVGNILDRLTQNLNSKLPCSTYKYYIIWESLLTSLRIINEDYIFSAFSHVLKTKIVCKMWFIWSYKELLLAQI